jgi:hypothetical protein
MFATIGEPGKSQRIRTTTSLGLRGAYPHSCLDFTFVAGKAKLWHSRSRVIVRDGDFPDDEKTSDHRPVELVVVPR